MFPTWSRTSSLSLMMAGAIIDFQLSIPGSLSMSLITRAEPNSMPKLKNINKLISSIFTLQLVLNLWRVMRRLLQYHQKWETKFRVTESLCTVTWFNRFFSHQSTNHLPVIMGQLWYIYNIDNMEQINVGKMGEDFFFRQCRDLISSLTAPVIPSVYSMRPEQKLRTSRYIYSTDINWESTGRANSVSTCRIGRTRLLFWRYLLSFCS